MKPRRSDACSDNDPAIKISFASGKVIEVGDQYMTVGASTWSPGASDWNTAVAAAMPEANSSEA